ncbi:B-box zinc finger protein 24-like [Zingiber officinale]|nr:B-box zinc finger protein 24-like [Zingiber officinale]
MAEASTTTSAGSALQPIGSLVLISTSLFFSFLPCCFLVLLRGIWRRKAPAAMKIQCDVCEKAPATVICCADEAALCGRCDVEVHAANKLASKHQRLLLDCLAARLPRCDICQEKAAFIFCVEDRALFCRDCDEPIHVAGTLSGDHRRYLATGIRVASSSSESKDDLRKITSPPEPPSPRPAVAVREAPSFLHSSPWGVHELLQLSDYESGDKKESLVGFGELDPFADFGFLHAQISGGGGRHAAAQVPELPNSGANFAGYCRKSKGSSSIALKRPRMELVSDEDDEFFTVPDLGKV